VSGAFVPGFDSCFAVFVAPDGIMFFGIWFAFWDAIICYVDDNICKLLNRILCTADSVSAEFPKLPGVKMLPSHLYGASK